MIMLPSRKKPCIVAYMKKKTMARRRAREVRESSVGWMLKSLSFGLDKEMKEELSRLGLTLSQFGVLMTLIEEEGLTQTEIGKRIAMPGYATSRTLDALAEKHIIKRRRDERSRRSYQIHFTGRGRKLGPKLFAVVDRVNKGLLSSLSSGEQKTLRALLRKLLDSRCAA
jgi:DNA-binding MarR family transcriptional regulator